MRLDRLFNTIAEIASERYGATVKVKEIRDESVVQHCSGSRDSDGSVRDRSDRE